MPDKLISPDEFIRVDTKVADGPWHVFLGGPGLPGVEVFQDANKSVAQQVAADIKGNLVSLLEAKGKLKNPANSSSAGECRYRVCPKCGASTITNTGNAECYLPDGDHAKSSASAFYCAFKCHCGHSWAVEVKEGEGPLK